MEGMTGLHHSFLKDNKFELKNIQYGFQRVIWGLAKKLILADRAYVFGRILYLASMYDILVDLLHIVLQFLCILYDMYIVTFAGGIDMVIGAAQMFGIKMDENFRQPLFFKSQLVNSGEDGISTLGTWMKDYIFYPMSLSKGMNKFGKWGKKHLGNHLGRTLPICFANLVIFFIVGIWHGADVRIYSIWFI